MKIQFFILFLCSVFLATAQETYSYISDHRFHDASELIGYNFKPNHMEVPQEYDKAINPGSYSFGVTLNNLYVIGDDIKGVYSINNINPEEYGYRLHLMNARDPTIQGHLKIILTRRKQVEALVFKRSNKDKEIIFFLPQLSEGQNKKETDFFTDRFEIELEHLDSIWGKSIRPFFLHHLDKNVQQKLLESDSTQISFEEIYRVTNKAKKKKKKEKKKDEDEEIDEETAAEIRMYEKNMTQIEEIMKLTSLREIEEGIAELDEEYQKKVKVEKEYYIIIRAILKYDDGTVEDKKDKIKIKKWSEREDEMAQKPEEERFQIDFLTDKGNHLYLYLNGKRAISSFEFYSSRYLMRGH